MSRADGHPVIVIKPVNHALNESSGEDEGNYTDVFGV